MSLTSTSTSSMLSIYLYQYMFTDRGGVGRVEPSLLHLLSMSLNSPTNIELESYDEVLNSLEWIYLLIIFFLLMIVLATFYISSAPNFPEKESFQQLMTSP